MQLKKLREMFLLITALLFVARFIFRTFAVLKGIELTVLEIATIEYKSLRENNK